MVFLKHCLTTLCYFSLLFGSFDLNAQLFIEATNQLPAAASSGQSVDAKAVDIDGDGDLDVILANEFQPNILLLNNGSAVFTNAGMEAIPQAVHDSEDIAVADFNQDGHTDIVFVSEDDFEHEYYFNNGNSTFSLASFLPFTSCNAVATGDLNRDGAPDVFLGNREQNMLLINNGSGELINETPDRLPSLSDPTHDVKLVDVDADGDEDILLGSENGNLLMINNGFGVFADESAWRLPQNLNIDTRKIVPADVDGDGDIDLFLATVLFLPGKDPQNRLWLNDGKGYFTDETEDRLPILPDQAVDGFFFDLDNDGDQDLAVSGVLNQPLKFYINQGDGFFQNRTNDVIGGTSVLTDSIDALAVLATDFNGDGYADIYLCNRAGQDRLLLRDPNVQLTGGTAVQVVKDGHALFHVYPNPTASTFVLKGRELASIQGALELTDLTGRSIAWLNPSSGGTLDEATYRLPPNLPGGTYLLRFTAANQLYALKLIRM